MNDDAAYSPTTRLANEAIEVAVAERGGKITSLRSPRTGREWLWKNPYLPLRTPPDAPASFGEFDFGGWDEILPSVSPCVVACSAWSARGITDHGELWSRRWRVRETSSDRCQSLAMVLDEHDLPFLFERTLSLAAGNGPLVADYTLESRSDAPLPYIWAAHPLIAIEPGMTINLPSDVRVNAAACLGLEFPSPSSRTSWPIGRLVNGHDIDLSRIPHRNAGVAVKLFTSRLREGRVELLSPDREEAIRISFDVCHVPYLGLWLNYGGWTGAQTEPYFNCGVEPTTSPHDDLTVAIRRGQVSKLQPGETRHWRLTVALRDGSYALGQ